MSSSALDTAAGERRRVLGYLLRSTLLAALICRALLHALRGLYGPAQPHPFHNLVSLVGQLDVLHSLCYSLLPAALLLLFVPRSGRRVPSAPLLSRCLIAGLGCAALALSAPCWTRRATALSPWRMLSGAYVALNVGALIWAQLHGLSDRARLRCWRALGLSDVLAPALLWHAARPRNSYAAAALRIVPAGMVCLAALAPWLIDPLPISQPLRPTVLLRQLLPGSFYQVLVEPIGGNLIVSYSDGGQLAIVDPAHPGGEQPRQVEPGFDFQSVGLDEGSGRLICIDVDQDKSVVLDSQTLDPLAVQRLNPPQRALSQCRALWFPGRQALYAYCATGLYALCPDGFTIKGHYPGLPGDALYSPTTDELIVAGWQQPLVALDPATLEPRRWTAVARHVERMALDQANGRLFLAEPLQSRVLVLDLRTFAEIGAITGLPGVRLIQIDAQRGLLILAGLSPLIEVRSLNDFSLVERHWGPPWTRWLTLDQGRGRAYVTSCTHGLFEIDLEAIVRRAGGRSLSGLDPFFRLVGGLAALLQPEIGWDEQALQQPLLPEAPAGAACTNGPWTGTIPTGN